MSGLTVAQKNLKSKWNCEFCQSLQRMWGMASSFYSSGVQGDQLFLHWESAYPQGTPDLLQPSVSNTLARIHCIQRSDNYIMVYNDLFIILQKCKK